MAVLHLTNIRIPIGDLQIYKECVGEFLKTRVNLQVL